MPSAWITLFDQLFILFLIPLLNFAIYPVLDRKSVSLSPLSRMSKYNQLRFFKEKDQYLIKYLNFPYYAVIGMLISLFAVLAAAVVEHLRLEQWQHG